MIFNKLTKRTIIIIFLIFLVGLVFIVYLQDAIPNNLNLEGVFIQKVFNETGNCILMKKKIKNFLEKNDFSKTTIEEGIKVCNDARYNITNIPISKNIYYKHKWFLEKIKNDLISCCKY